MQRKAVFAYRDKSMAYTFVLYDTPRALLNGLTTEQSGDELDASTLR